jgi:hypothetical protein
MAHRFLGEGNEFVLGATGRPNLAMLADYALKTLDLWFWFAAFVAFAYREVLLRADPELLKTYHDTAEAAKPVAAGFASHSIASLPKNRLKCAAALATSIPKASDGCGPTIIPPLFKQTGTAGTKIAHGTPADVCSDFSERAGS